MDKGYTGTEEEWLLSLVGSTGEAGRGIVDISLTESNDNVDTYTITYSDGTTSVFYVRNGKNGTDGEDGADGKDGADGRDGIDGKNGANGATGATGTAGVAGGNGTNGKDGAAGVSGTYSTSTDSGTGKSADSGVQEAVEVSKESGTESNVESGTYGLENIEVDKNGNLVLKLSGGKEINAGHVNEEGQLETNQEDMLRIKKALRLAWLALILAIIAAGLSVASLVMYKKEKSEKEKR